VADTSVQAFSAGTIEAVAKVIGDLYSGSELTRMLASIKLADLLGGVALACAHSGALATQAKREVSRLCDDTSKSPYKILFNACAGRWEAGHRTRYGGDGTRPDARPSRCRTAPDLNGAGAALVVGVIEGCAVAAFARVARQITGCSPTTSYIGELLDERRAVMEVEMVMTCSRKGPQTQFTPELGLRLRGDRKRRQSRRVS
jgi:hypothetical protein